MKFTDKFTLITISVAVTGITLVLLGGFFSLRALTHKYHQQRIDSVVNVIERQFDKDKNIEKNQLDGWLPDLLDVSGVVRLQIKKHDALFYQSYDKNQRFYPEYLLLRYQYHLQKYPDISLILHARQPYDDINFSVGPLVGVALAILLSLSLLALAIHWIKKLFKGAELLDRRAKYLLQNNPTARTAQDGEWPKLASKALDVLLEKLEESKKERSYFDAYIRGQAFLDEATGLGNRLALENRLDAIAIDANILCSALFLVKFSELESLSIQYGKHIRKQMLQQIADLLRKFAIRYDDQFLGRISKSKFVLMIPQMSYQETEIAAKQLTKLLFQLQLPKTVSIEEFFHIGVVHFPYGAKPPLIMEELNRALLVAVHQKASGWFLADPQDQDSGLSKGTVKWRALLENILDNDLLFFYYQKVMRKDAASELYTELLPRIRDQQQNIIATGTLFAMAEKCGLDEKVDRKLLEKVLALLVSRGELSKPIAINLGIRILMDKTIQQWFVYELMQLPRYLRNNLVIEVSEHLLGKNYLPLRSVLNLLQKIGCKIVIDDVGKSVVSTEYIIDYNIDYLKLHPSLVRDIHLRKTNQIALQSLMASCLNSRAKIIAVGIENIDEWKCLLKLGVYGGQGTFFSDVQPLSSI